MVAAKDLMRIFKTYNVVPDNVRVAGTHSASEAEIMEVMEAAAEQTACPVCNRRDLALVQLPDHWASGQCRPTQEDVNRLQPIPERPTTGSAVTMSWPAADSMRDLEKSVSQFVNDVAMCQSYWPNNYIQDVAFLAFQMYSRDMEILELTAKLDKMADAILDGVRQ